MILKPKDQETLGLALSLEQGIKEGKDSIPFNIANNMLNMYIDSIVKVTIVGQNQVKALSPSMIEQLSTAQFWTLIYMGVVSNFEASQGNVNFIIGSALETFKEEHPEVSLENEELTIVSIANLIIETGSFDIVLALQGFTSILSKVKFEEVIDNPESTETL